MTIEDIADNFKLIDTDKNKILTLTELSLFYKSLVLEKGLFKVLMGLISQADKNEDQ